MYNNSLLPILSIFGGIFMFVLIIFLVRLPGVNLTNKFAKMGVLVGKTYREITNIVGQENSKSFIVDENGNPITVRQWMRTGCHIVLLFDANDVCLGLSSQTNV